MIFKNTLKFIVIILNPVHYLYRLLLLKFISLRFKFYNEINEIVHKAKDFFTISSLSILLFFLVLEMSN